jgi:shikimate kinase
LGKLVAEKLDFPYLDIDDYIWRKDTDKPFTVMYTREEKINRLMTDISKGTLCDGRFNG